MTSHAAIIRRIALGMVLLGGTVAARQQQPTVNDAPQPAPPTTSQKDEPAVKAAVETKTTTNAGAEEVVIQGRKDKMSYAFGASIGRDLKRQKDGLNVDLLLRALTDALNGKPLVMTDSEVAATLKQVEAEEKLDFEHAKMMISEKNRKAGETFFAENAKKEGVVTLPSGLQYKILKKGDGKIPTLTDTVVCNYRGTLLDGTEIDSSFKRKEPTAVPVNGVIPGWTQALQVMPVGSKWQMFIPPQLAYGDKGTPAFGPNSTLIFEVELLSIQDRPQTVGAVQPQPPPTGEAR